MYILQYPPHCYLASNGSEEILVEQKFSIELEMLHTAEKRFNFRSKLVNANQSWGYLTTQDRTGLIHMVVNQVSKSMVILAFQHPNDFFRLLILVSVALRMPTNARKWSISPSLLTWTN